MGAHDDLAGELWERADKFLVRLDTLKKYLMAGRKLKDDEPMVYGFIELESRASAAIGCCAELESLTRSMLQLTHKELNLLCIDYKDILPPLRQLAAHGVFESLRTLQDQGKLWEKRKYASTLDGCGDPAAFPVVTKNGPQPPLDGRTLRPEHFNRIWSIYGLSGDPFPTVAWAGSLQKLALCRNDVAHGNIPFFEIFQQAGRSSAEIESYIEDVGNFAIHFADTWCAYLDSRGYLTNV